MYTEGEETVADTKPPRPRPEINLPAVFEVAAVAAGFILITQLVLGTALTREALQDIFEGSEATILAGFFLGAVVQLIFVVILHAAGQEDVKAAVSSLKEKARPAGWQISGR